VEAFDAPANEPAWQLLQNVLLVLAANLPGAQAVHGCERVPLALVA
jgi:hypothetical protein